MNKKIIAIVLSITMIVGYSFSVLAAQDTLGSGDLGTAKERSVTATYTKTGTNVVSVTITWGDLKYTYADNVKWDSVHSYYVPDNVTPSTVWNLTDGTNNNQNALVKIDNASDKKLNAKIKFAQEDSGTSGISGTLTGTFYKSSDFTGDTVSVDPAVNVLGTAAAPDSDSTSLEAYLKITGDPATISSASVNGSSTLGKVTVTVSDVS